MRMPRPALLLGIVAAVWAGAVVVIFVLRDGGIVADHVDRARAAARDSALAAHRLVSGEIEDLGGLAWLMARGPDVAAVLDVADRAGLGALEPVDRERLLTTDSAVGTLSRAFAAVGDRLSLDAIFLLDRDGRLVATGDWQTVARGAFGKSFAFRGYFADAAKTGAGMQFVVGTLSHEAGLFYAAAVPSSVDDAPRGVVVVKGSPAAVIGQLPETGATVLVSNGDGVVILGSRPGYALQRLDSGTPVISDAALERYGTASMPAIAARPAGPGLWSVACACPVDGRTVAWESAGLGIEGWQVHGLVTLDGLRGDRETNVLLGALVFLVGLLLAAFLSRAAAYVRAVRERAIRDPLTGAYNRSYLEEILPRVLAQHDRGTVGSLSLAVFDIDRFKEINDRHGHAVGDRVVRAVASLIEEAARRADVAFRVGGDEFAVLLVGADAAAARAFAERVRATIEATGVPPRLDPGTVTVSCGVAARRAGEAFESLLQRADEKLYEVKRQGRNGVAAADAAPCRAV